MHKPWLKLARVLWVLLALNSLVQFGLTMWVTLQILQNPSARLIQGLAEQGLSLEFYEGYIFVSVTAVFLAFFIVALLIFLGRPNDGFALLAAIFLLNFGTTNSYPQFAEFLQFYSNQPLWYAVPNFLTTLFSYPLFVAFFASYPDGQFVPHWTRYVAAYMFVLALAWTFFPSLFTATASPLAVGASVTVILSIAVCFYAQIWRYRHTSSRLQKQQTKWFVLALAFFLVVTIPEIFVPLLQINPLSSPAESIVSDLATATATLSYIILPIALGIAILRYRLWDIDVLIRRTVTYGLLAALPAAIYFGSVILLQQLLASISGQHSEVITVVSTLAIAALFIPLRNRIQHIIDRRFYRNKYDAQQVLHDFATSVRDETDLEKLTGSLVGVVNETMQPRSVSLWLKRGMSDK